MADADENNYIESEDEDFDPTAVDKDENISSSDDEDDDEAPVKTTAKSARKRPPAPAEELDSGDEATIQEQTKKRRKTKDVEDDSGGEGGLIKTRAQRRAEKEERKENRQADKGPVTIDVDDLWAKLTATPVGRPSKSSSALIEVIPDKAEEIDAAPQDNLAQADESAWITIKQTYEFAGQTVSEEKQVHRDSAEAKLYLSKNKQSPTGTAAPDVAQGGMALRRPPKRASMFEPNPTGEVKGLPAHKQRLRTPSRADAVALQKRLEEEARVLGTKAQRLNTVQKSKLDWATHVDDEGLKTELDEYGRSKHGYMEKMDFLQNVQGRRDQEERQARLQGVQ